MPGARFVADTAESALLGIHSEPRRALFLDRDGVINVDHQYVHTREETEWLPGIFDLCNAGRAEGFLLIVITNQAGIARGLYTEDEFITYTRWVHEEFSKRGVSLLATYYCPHHPESGLGSYLLRCGCRKPAPGMILDAAERYGIILSDSWLIGNRESDIAAGVAAKVGRTLLLDSTGNLEAHGDDCIHACSLEDARQILRSAVGK